MSKQLNWMGEWVLAAPVLKLTLEGMFIALKAMLSGQEDLRAGSTTCFLSSCALIHQPLFSIYQVVLSNLPFTHLSGKVKGLVAECMSEPSVNF